MDLVIPADAGILDARRLNGDLAAASMRISFVSVLLRQRRNFANDPDNLIVTTAAANLSKGDRTPSAWLPKADAGRCLVVRTFVNTARTYALPITKAERRVILATLGKCDGH